MRGSQKPSDLSILFLFSRKSADFVCNFRRLPLGMINCKVSGEGKLKSFSIFVGLKNPRRQRMQGQIGKKL
jgi:hypothetical protein